MYHISKFSFLSVFVLFFTSCSNNATPPAALPSAVSVTTIDVKAENISYYDEYPATLVPLNQVTLIPQVNGYITGMYFKEGDRVKKGQKLYTIDAQMYAANYQQSVANLAVLEANLVRAQKDADRYHELAKKDAIALQQVDNADATLAATKKQIESAKAATQSAQTSVRYTTITAPFDGTIGISQVRLGASVSAGQTVLNTVSSDNPMAVDVVIDQKEIYRFTKLKDSKSSDTIFALAFGNDVYPFYGYISTIDRAVDPLTSTIKVRLTFPNKENLIKAGMSGTLRVLNAGNEPSIKVPYKAITEQLGEFFVYKVSGNTVSQTRLKLGKAMGENIIVKEGLVSGDKIVVEGVQNLKEGSSITIAPEPKNN